MSALIQKTIEKYYGKSTSPREWFESREEPEDQVQGGGGAYEQEVGVFLAGGLQIKERKIRSASLAKDYDACYQVFPGIRKVVNARGHIYATRQQRQLDARKIFIALEPSVESQFRALATKWKEDTKLTSSSSEMILNPSYQRIIGLGPEVIPLVLKDLQESGCHWFWALQALSGKNPIKAEDAGRVKKMAQAWLEWGRENGLI